MSANVTLREVTGADLEIFYQHQADPEAVRMAQFNARGRADFMAHWAKILADPAVTARAILCDGQVAGNIVSFLLGDKRDVGYWLGRDFWGRGVATQALRAFLEVERKRPLHGRLARSNIASRRALEKCGFTFLREDIYPLGAETVEDYVFRLVDPAMPSFDPSPEFARLLDAQDPLAGFRAQFRVSDPGLIYLDGNSLGRMPERTPALLRAVLDEQWGERLVRAWGEGWLTAPSRTGEKIARLVGAAPGQVVVADSTSMNLYKLVMAALDLRPDRSRILSDTHNFPSDLYIFQGCIRALGGRHSLRLVDTPFPDTQAILDAIDEDTALVALSHAAFKSGGLYDAGAITRRAHERGALALWDLSHSAGAVPVLLDTWGADFAVGCSYKYFNGGPGAPAYLYVRRDLQAQALSPVWGWFGEARPFAFDLEYHPAVGIERFLCGSPPLLSLLAIEPGLDLLLEAGILPLREKSVRQTAYLIGLFDHALAPLGFSLGSPRDPAARGSHISIRHPEGYRINRALIEEMSVIPDFREPDNIRLGIAPIYTTYTEIWQAVERIARVVQEGRYARYALERGAVT